MGALDNSDLASVSTQELRASIESVSIPTESSKAEFSNWAKTFRCKPQRVFAPTTVWECRSIIELARREGARLHPVGVGHSPSDLACTNGWLMRMEGLKGFIRVSVPSYLLTVANCQNDHKAQTASFYGGTTLDDIHISLQQCTPALALRNIGSISDQTIGGLISTASHGSGVTFPVLSRHVKSMRLALPLPGAPIVRVSAEEDSDLFKATLCGLGATGLILEVEIEVEEAFRLRETKTPYTVDAVLDNLDTIKGSAEHVRVWWYPDGQGMIVGRADRVYEVSLAVDDDYRLTRSLPSQRHR
jgi:L-gulonolactone oxidase